MENNDNLKNTIKTKIAISKYKEENIAMKKNKNYIFKTIAVACFCIIFTTGIVFAKDIGDYFKSLFNNSSKAIDMATQNEYIQNEDMEYVYDNNIGIRVNDLILDDLNLDILFEFKVDNKDIKSIRCENFNIISDTGKKIYDSELQYSETLEDVYLAHQLIWNIEPQKVNENIFRDSILLGLRETEIEINELKIEINSVHIIYQDNTMEDISGSWNFNLKIKDDMKRSQKITYKLKTEDEYIESCKGILNPTGLEIEITSKTPLEPMKYVLDHQNIRGPWMFYLNNRIDLVSPSDFQVGNVECTKFVLRYDEISIFDVPDKMEIYIEPFDSTIILTKEQ